MYICYSLHALIFKCFEQEFLESISNILNLGDVPGLIVGEEKEAVLVEIAQYMDPDVQHTRESTFAFFLERIRHNLHIIISMSPVGDKFRSRCRQFPSIINCCTIDWFSSWPKVCTSMSANIPSYGSLPHANVIAWHKL